eukprot:9470949-Pyramimonas_sp.AAC.1
MPLGVSSGISWDSSWDVLGASRWSWGPLGASWVHQGALWGFLVVSWVHLGGLLVASWGLGASEAPLGATGSFRGA